MKRASDPVSSSELNAWFRCERYWSAEYRYESWLRPRNQAHFALGTAYHKVAEAYLRNGLLPLDPAEPLTEMLMAALPHLPAPATFTSIEERQDFVFEGLPFQVTADWVGPRLIVDHKTSKDPNRYGLRTREQKLEDPQTILYSFRHLPDGGVFNHIYIKKHRAAVVKYEGITDQHELKRYEATPRVYGTPIEFTREEITSQMRERIVPAAERVYSLRNKYITIDPLTMAEPKDKNKACLAYGGCPYMDRCWPQGFVGTDTGAPAKAPAGPSLAERIAAAKAPPPSGGLSQIVSELESTLAKLRALL